MSIHNFKPGETFCRGSFDTWTGDVKIQDDLILIWKGQFAYPDYRFLTPAGKEIRSSELSGSIFGKNYQEVSDEIRERVTQERDKLNALLENLDALDKESDVEHT